MDRRLLALSSVLALSAAGNLYTLIGGVRVGVTITQEAKADAIGLTRAAAVPLADAMAASGSPGGVDCKLGVISNHPSEWYCWRGTAGFLVRDEMAVTELNSLANNGSVSLSLGDGGGLYADGP